MQRKTIRMNIHTHKYIKKKGKGGKTKSISLVPLQEMMMMHAVRLLTPEINNYTKFVAEKYSLGV